jgi:hypothetical protein
MFGPYKLNKDISITQKKKFQENEILFIKNWDITFNSEGILLYFMAACCVITGINPNLLINLIDWTSINYTNKTFYFYN